MSVDERLKKLEDRVTKLEKMVGKGDSMPKSVTKKKDSRGSSSKKKGGSKKKTTDKKKKRGGTKGSAPKIGGVKKRLSGVPRNDFYTLFGKKQYYDFPTDPVNWKEEKKNEKPDQALELEWVYGFRGSLKDNLFFTPKEQGGEFLYTVAGMAVLYNPGEHTQRYFGLEEHTEDVSTCCLHPKLAVAATGQIDPKGKGKPHFCVWNYKTLRQLIKKEHHDRAIDVLSFSHDGKYLFSVGADDSRTGAVWDCPDDDDEPKKWKKTMGEPVCEQMTNKEPVWGVRWANSVINREGKDQYEFVSFGMKLFKWHSLIPHPSEKGRLILDDESPSTYSQTKLTQKFYSCAAWNMNEDGEGGVIVGTHTGHIYTFHKNQQLQKFLPVSKKPIGALVARPEFYVAGSDDKKIRFFDWSHACTETIDCAGKISSMHGDPDDNEIGIGMTNSQIWVLSLDDKKLEKVNDGFNDEVWALSVHISKPWVLVGSMDKRIKVYDYETRKSIFEKKTKDKIGSCAFSGNGKFAAFGTKDGDVLVINVEEMDEKEDYIYKKKICKEQIDCMTFTENSKYLVFGSWDQTIRILVTKDWKLKKPLKGHTSSVIRVTVAMDNDTIASNSKDMETLYWTIGKAKRIESDQVDKNLCWHQWKNLIGWCVQGVFWKSGDFTDVNSVAISGSSDWSNDGGKKLVAAGDDMGLVSIYQYPCCEEDKPAGREYLAHSSHVTDCRFTPDSSRLITAGGGDLSVMQWKIVDAPEEPDSD